jgi:thioredoxin 1
MSEREISAQDFESTVGAIGIVVLDFWAAWCGPCRTFAPIFAAAAGRHPDVTWGKVDTEAEPELSGALGIRSIPTLMVFRDGVQIFRHSGVLPAQALDDIIGKVKDLDMDAVRAEIAASEPG